MSHILSNLNHKECKISWRNRRIDVKGTTGTVFYWHLFIHSTPHHMYIMGDSLFPQSKLRRFIDRTHKFHIPGCNHRDNRFHCLNEIYRNSECRIHIKVDLFGHRSTLSNPLSYLDMCYINSHRLRKSQKNE